MYELEVKPSNIWEQEVLHSGLLTPMNSIKIDERLRAGQRIRFWALNQHIPFIKEQNLADHLAKLLGYTCYAQLMYGHNDRVSEILQALVGPHGFAIYKALEAKRG